MTKRELIADLKRHGDDDEEVQVVIDDGAENLDELEEGSVLEITEVGGYAGGMRLIRVKPR